MDVTRENLRNITIFKLYNVGIGRGVNRFLNDSSRNEDCGVCSRRDEDALILDEWCWTVEDGIKACLRGEGEGAIVGDSKGRASWVMGGEAVGVAVNECCFGWRMVEDETVGFGVSTDQDAFQGPRGKGSSGQVDSA